MPRKAKQPKFLNTPLAAKKPIDIKNGPIPLQASRIDADGRTLTLLKRNPYAAIFVKKRKNITTSHEVFRVKIRPKEMVHGQEYPEREVYPSNEDFGKTAKSCLSFEAAYDWFEYFTEQEKDYRNKKLADKQE